MPLSEKSASGISIGICIQVLSIDGASRINSLARDAGVPSDQLDDFVRFLRGYPESATVAPNLDGTSGRSDPNQEISD